MLSVTKTKHPKLINPIEKAFDNITRYHYCTFFILFTSNLPIFWHVLNLIFLSPPINYYCGTQPDNSTRNICPCENPLWDRSVFTQTMQSKFGLLCSSKWLVRFSESMHFVGMLLGAFVLGFLSDKYGRLSMFSLSCFILSTFGCLVSAMPTVESFIIMRCFEGIGAGGATVTVYVLCVEYCGVTHREVVTALFHLPINLAHMTLPGVSYFLRHCDVMQLVISIPLFLFVALKWIVLESPKWLMDNGYIDEAVAVMDKFGRFNGKPCVNIREQIEEYLATHADISQIRMTFWQIFKHRKLSLNLGCMSVIYFLCGLGYYGVSQYIGKMSGNIHTNVALSGALLLPGTVTAIFLLQLLPRRLFLMGTNFLSGFFLIIVICIPLHLILIRVIIVCLCNCFFFMSFIIVFLYSVELFPTSVRNSALGFLSVVSRIGQILAPQVNTLSDTASIIIYGVMAIFGTFLCYLLPETKNVELPSSLDESNHISRKMRQFEDDSPKSIQINSPKNVNESTL